MNVSQIANIKQSSSQQLENGWVQDITANGYVIRLSNHSTLIAQKSFGCTVVPEKDDLVMFTRTQEAGIFILNILQRKSESPATMSFSNGLELQSNEALTLRSSSLNLENLETSLLTQNYNVHSNKVNVVTEDARLQSRNIESTADRLILKLKDSFKIIERLEQVSARDVIQNIKNAFLQRSRQVDISAKSDVKINGERIHMG